LNGTSHFTQIMFGYSQFWKWLKVTNSSPEWGVFCLSQWQENMLLEYWYCSHARKVFYVPKVELCWFTWFI